MSSINFFTEIILDFWIQKFSTEEDFPILSYPIVSYPNRTYLVLSYPIVSYPILSYFILSYLIPSYPILIYHILSWHIISHFNFLIVFQFIFNRRWVWLLMIGRNSYAVYCALTLLSVCAVYVGSVYCSVTQVRSSWHPGMTIDYIFRI